MTLNIENASPNIVVTTHSKLRQSTLSNSPRIHSSSQSQSQDPEASSQITVLSYEKQQLLQLLEDQTAENQRLSQRLEEALDRIENLEQVVNHQQFLLNVIGKD
ncbi:hypothetical protein P9112_006828 [Eukaryota sp. TZLM1-RC]